MSAFLKLFLTSSVFYHPDYLAKGSYHNGEDNLFVLPREYDSITLQVTQIAIHEKFLPLPAVNHTLLLVRFTCHPN